MNEPVIRNLTLPEVTVEDILRAEGANTSKRPVRQRIIELYEGALKEALTLAQPKAIWVDSEITGYSETELRIPGGTLKSKLLARMAGPGQKLVLFAMTIGSAVDEQISAYQRANNMSSALALDETASTLVSKGTAAELGKIEENYRREGLKTTFPMGPGHSYWQGLEDLEDIFDILKPELIGISLNESNLMQPRKSVCMVMGVGDNLPTVNGKTHCDFCSLKKSCHLSMGR